MKIGIHSLAYQLTEWGYGESRFQEHYGVVMRVSDNINILSLLCLFKVLHKMQWLQPKHLISLITCMH